MFIITQIKHVYYVKYSYDLTWRILSLNYSTLKLHVQNSYIQRIKYHCENCNILCMLHVPTYLPRDS